MDNLAHWKWYNDQRTILKQIHLYYLIVYLCMFFFYAGLWHLLYLEYLMHIFAVNVALDKPAYMQYQYKPGDNRYDASNAVDGQKLNLSFNGGQCSSSVASKQTATWWVNLTKIYNIHHIRIYFLKSRYEWGMVIFNCCPLITYTSS